MHGFRLIKRVLILLIVFSFTSKAQVSYFESYYPTIDKAEYAFAKDDFKEAIRQYNIAFRSVESPKARDIFNGIVCYYLTGNIDGAKPWLLLLAKKGISTDVIESQEVFNVSSIKEAWINFKPVYLQIYSTQELEQDEYKLVLIDKVNYSIQQIRDAYDEISVISETTLTASDSLEVKNLYNKIQVLYGAMSEDIAEYLLEHGFNKENEYPIVQTDMMSDNFRSFLGDIHFYPSLKTSKKDTILGLPKEEFISKFNHKLLEEVDNGNIHRDWVLNSIKGDYKLESLYFVRARFVEGLECDSGKSELFLKPKIQNDARFFDKLLGSNEEYLIQKGKYSIFDNEFFLMNSVAIYEDLAIDNCEELKLLEEKYRKIEN